VRRHVKTEALYLWCLEAHLDEESQLKGSRQEMLHNDVTMVQLAGGADALTQIVGDGVGRGLWLGQSKVGVPKGRDSRLGRMYKIA
jgi:hypothetical protein